jgi:hypothetical protein
LSRERFAVELPPWPRMQDGRNSCERVSIITDVIPSRAQTTSNGGTTTGPLAIQLLSPFSPTSAQLICRVFRAADVLWSLTTGTERAMSYQRSCVTLSRSGPTLFALLRRRCFSHRANSRLKLTTFRKARISTVRLLLRLLALADAGKGREGLYETAELSAEEDSLTEKEQVSYHTEKGS